MALNAEYSFPYDRPAHRRLAIRSLPIPEPLPPQEGDQGEPEDHRGAREGSEQASTGAQTEERPNQTTLPWAYDLELTITPE